MTQAGKTFLTTTLMMLSLCACDKKVAFSPTSAVESLNGTDAVSPAPSCTTEIVEKKKRVQVLFVVDQSGSNINGPFGFPGEATDPTKGFRYGIIADFLTKHEDQKNLGWSFITFNDGNAHALVNDGDDQTAVFKKGATAIRSAFDRFFATADEGDTPYRSALRMAADTIRDDQDKPENEGTHYLVAFITDGHPTDYCPGGQNEKDCPGRIQEDEIDKDVRRLMRAARDQISLGSVYYGRPDTDAAQRLKRMADLGSGQFVDLNFNSNINLNDIIRVPESVCKD